MVDNPLTDDDFENLCIIPESICIDLKNQFIKPIVFDSNSNRDSKLINFDHFQYNDEKVKQESQSTQKQGKTCCNCKNSKCLKLYCDCLRNGQACGPDCNCNSCENKVNNEARNKKLVELTKKADKVN